MKHKAYAVLGLALALSIPLAVPGFAAEETHEKATQETIAYMDVDAASSQAERNAILEARNQLIYGDQAWTVNGAVSKISADGTKEALPDFYDLFPEDWSIPMTNHRTTRTYEGLSIVSSDELYRGNFVIPKEDDSNWDTEPFFSWNAKEDGRAVGVAVIKFAADRDALYNASFTNVDSGTDLGWVPGLLVGSEGAQLENPSELTRYGAIVSMVQQSGSGTVMVDYVDNWSDIGWEPIA